MFEPVQSAVSINIVIALVLSIVHVPSSCFGALVEETKVFAGQERGKFVFVISHHIT